MSIMPQRFIANIEALNNVQASKPHIEQLHIQTNQLNQTLGKRDFCERQYSSSNQYQCRQA